ncbi:DUF309 domain-containing protein [Hydrogenimonas sp.]
MEEACARFIELLEAGEYYEAHEALEAYWFPRRFEDRDEVRLVKGFINASVAFELLKRGRPEPARRTWGVYLKYRPLLAACDAPHFRRVDAALQRRYDELFGS